MDIGKRIASLRNSKGLNQVQLATALNVSPSTVAMWETNKRALKDETISQLAEFFGVSSDYILGLTNSKQPPSDAQKRELTIQQALDGVMSYDGEPLTDNDREVLRRIIEGYLDKK